MELLQEFEYDLVRIDGAELDLDWDVFVDWDFDDMESEGHHPIQLKLIIYNLEKAYGELCLTVTHIESGKQIQRVLNVLSQEETPNQRKCQVQSQRSGQVLSQQQVN